MRITDVFIVATSLLRPNVPGGDITCFLHQQECSFLYARSVYAVIGELFSMSVCESSLVVALELQVCLWDMDSQKFVL